MVRGGAKLDKVLGRKQLGSIWMLLMALYRESVAFVECSPYAKGPDIGP